MKKILTVTLLLLCISITADAKLTVTRLMCNYQSGLAITRGDICLGWQMTSDVNDDSQIAYQIKIYENVTGRQMYDSRKVKSSESQLVKMPTLTYNAHGYEWQVRVWNAKNKPSEWSKKQQIRVVPAIIDAEWIGAITNKDAKLPEGRFSNAELRKILSSRNGQM